MRKILLSINLFLIVALPAIAQINHVSLLTAKPRLYELTAWDIKLTANWENPYLQEDITLDMMVTSPSGKKLILPCYYESGNSEAVSDWEARFTPQETGKYSCYFKLTRAAGSINSKASTFTVGGSPKKGFLHPKDNWAFQFDNGQSFRGIGENLAWESRASDDSKYFKALHENSKYNYEYMLRSLAAHGGNFFRTWICPWNLPIDWKRGFNSNRYTASTAFYNPSAIKKMDRLVTLSDSLGVYMMLTLGEGASTIKDGGYAASAADFFVNPKSKALYKNRLRYFIARWGYSSAIAAWELFNEVDNVEFSNKENPIDPATIVAWHDEMSAYIKAIDPYHHLVTTSISHRDLKGLDALPAIDFNQKHIYKNTTAIPGAIVDYEYRFQKPYVIGEYGYEWDWSKNFDAFAPEMDSDFKRGLWYGLFSPTPILPMSWWWEFFDSRGTDAYILKIRSIEDKMLAAGQGSFETLSVNASLPGVKVYSVKCGQTTFVYAYNPGDSVKSISINVASALTAGFKVTVYDCESGTSVQSADPQASGDMFTLPAFDLTAKSDKIFIIGK